VATSPMTLSAAEEYEPLGHKCVGGRWRGYALFSFAELRNTSWII
jgi:hypothetical protein